MVANSLRRCLVVIALLMSALCALRAEAQCCGSAYSAYYPAAYTAYSPPAYTSYYGYYGGWYPGYWLDRIRARVWGSPSTYVAAYPSTYYASYAPSYAVGYRPAYSVGYAASYAAPACSSCSTCSSCSSYAAGYSPCSSCSSGCAPCSACSTCATPTASQAVYQQPAGCASCGAAAPVMTAPGAVVMPAPGATVTPSPVPQQAAPAATDSRPELAPSEQVGPRTYQRPADAEQQNGEQQPVQPAPGTDDAEKDPYKVEGDSSTYFQAPKLFDPNDRTAKRSLAPVTTALYQKQVSYRAVSAGPITLEQAQRDAAGWVSAAK
jgi:hypothetical protein